MKKLLSIILFVILSAQLAYALPSNVFAEKTKSEITNYILLDEVDEIIPSGVRVKKPTSSIELNYKFLSNEDRSIFKKGNSLFYIHNQLLPKTLTTNKITAAFFTSYFSTSV